MKSTSIISVALITCTAYMLPAAFSTSSSWQADPLLARTVACIVSATDECSIVGFYQTLPANPLLYPKGPAFGNHFGFAIVETDDTIPAAMHQSKTLFDQKDDAAPYFEVNDTELIDFDLNRSKMELPTYTREKCMGRRYVLLCSQTERNLFTKRFVEEMYEKNKSKQLDFATMLAFVKGQLPNTTFVLFDAATYEEERAMYHIPETRRTMLMQAAFARKKSPSGHYIHKHHSRSSSIS